MIRVVIAELRKLRRPSLLLGTIATVGGLSALFTSIVLLTQIHRTAIGAILTWILRRPPVA